MWLLECIYIQNVIGALQMVRMMMMMSDVGSWFQRWDEKHVGRNEYSNNDVIVDTVVDRTGRDSRLSQRCKLYHACHLLCVEFRQSKRPNSFGIRFSLQATGHYRTVCLYEIYLQHGDSVIYCVCWHHCNSYTAGSISLRTTTFYMH